MLKTRHAKTILLIVLLFSLLVSIALNVVLLKMAIYYYQDANDAYLDPLSLDYYPTQPTMKPDAKILVFFGDSRAWAWSPPHDIPFDVINRGIGGQTSAQVAARFDYHIAPLRPQVILVQAGVNDLKSISAFPERQADIIAKCKANLKQVVDQSVRQNSTVILTTIFPLGHVPLERQLFWSDEVSLAIVDVNNYLKSLASERVIIFDSFTILVDNTGNVRKDYQGDLLHINQAGYDALNMELKRLLISLAK